MTLSSALGGALHTGLVHVWTLLPAEKSQALSELVSDLKRVDVNKRDPSFWQKHAKDVLWPHSSLQFAAIVAAVTSCICLLSTLLSFVVCIVGILGAVACGVLAAAGLALVVFGATTIIICTTIALVTGTISVVAFTCTCFGIAAVGVWKGVTQTIGGASIVAAIPRGRRSNVPPSIAATAELDMQNLPGHDSSRTPQDSPLTPHLISEMQGAPRATADRWPLSDPLHARQCSRLKTETQLPERAVSPEFFSVPCSESLTPSLAYPQLLSQSASMGPSSILTNASLFSMQLGSESALGAESGQSRNVLDDHTAPHELQNLSLQCHSLPLKEGSTKPRRRMTGKDKKQRSSGGPASSVTSVATERSVEDIMDSAFMGSM